MRIGVSSYSYSKLVTAGKIQQIEVVSLAKKAGFEAIEFSTISVPEGEKLADFAKKLRDECAREEIAVTNYTIGADFLTGSGGNLEEEINRVKAEVDIARILGSPGMRHDASNGFPAGKTGARDFDSALPRLVKGCRDITEYAEQFGIKTMVENHGRFCQDSRRVEKLVCGVDHPNFGILIDMGNFLGADEDPGQAAGRLIAYAVHVHAKDFHVKPGDSADPGRGWTLTRGGNFSRAAIIGHGNVPILKCLRIMKNSGYEGFLSIEFEGIEDPLKGIELSRENLCRYVNEIYHNPQTPRGH